MAQEITAAAPTSPWREAWRWFRRDLRNGELTLLLLALILAVAATTSLRFFSSGVDKRLQQEAAQLIAADLVVRSTRPIPEHFLTLAKVQNLATAQTLEFSSVLVHGDAFQLASVKAVSAGYPLRGELRLREQNREVATRAIPPPGTLWLDARLMALLQVKPGDGVQVGEALLRVGPQLAYEPDQGGFAGFSPRALMNLADVPATRVIQPGSRINYRLLLRGGEPVLAAFRRAVEPQLGVGMRLQDVHSGRTGIGTPLLRAQRYFSLATIAAVVLAGLAIVTSSRRFAERRYDLVALLRCLGASRRDIWRRLFGEMFWLWLLALLAGALLGLVTAQLMNLLLAGLLPGGAPLLALWRPLLTGIATATLTLAGFALPALLALANVAPLRVLRRELPPLSWSRAAAMASALLALLLLLALETGEAQLALIVVAGGGTAALLAWWGLGRLLQMLRSAWPQSDLARLLRQPRATATQILGLALGLTALLLVVSLRGELLSAWQAKIPAQAPNQFALNIAPEERAPFTAFLREAGLEATPPYAIVRGRLSAINGRPPQQTVSKDDDASGDERDESLKRELNLTWRAGLPEGNRLVAGHWWRPGDKPLYVSVEQKLAQRLGLKPGDRLHFSMAEGELEATIGSLREVDWDSFRPNFYFIFPPGALDAFPASYLTSFYVPPEKRGVLTQLVQRFPTVILIDVATVMQQVRQLLDQVARAVEVVLLFVLAGGLLVVAAHVLATLDARRQEAALLRVIGIGRRALQARLAAEFIFLGSAAGLVAALLNEALAAAIYIRVLELPPSWHPALWWQAPLAGALLVLAAGLPGARAAWRASPLLVLRRNG